MVDEIVANRQFHEAFAAPGVFPSDFLHALENAELAGATAESLLVLSRDYEERAKNAMKWLAWILGIVIWLMVGGLMVLMIFRLAWAVYFKPMYDIMDDLQHGRV
jgi:type II secretory pathway component PulF